MPKPPRKPGSRHSRTNAAISLRENPTAYRVNGNAHFQKLKVLDTFAGAGGFSLGFELAGCEVVGGIEIDAWASETFAHNHTGAAAVQRDLQTISNDELLDLFANRRPDVLLGGPPCQGFSICRKNAGDPTDPRNSLFVEFLRVAKVFQPEFLIMENVPNIENARTHTGESVLGIIKRELQELDCHVTHTILEATDFGIPQIRRRLFVLASARELGIPFPKPTHTVQSDEQDLFGGLLEHCPTLWEAISDLPKLQAGEGCESQNYPTLPQNDYQRELRKGGSTLWNHTAMRHSKRMVERFAAMTCGQSVSDVPQHLRPLKRNGNGVISGKVYDQNNRRMHPDRPCHTIPASFSPISSIHFSIGILPRVKAHGCNHSRTRLSSKASPPWSATSCSPVKAARRKNTCANTTKSATPCRRYWQRPLPGICSTKQTHKRRTTMFVHGILAVEFQFASKNFNALVKLLHGKKSNKL